MKKLLIIICIFSLTGCYDYTEIDDTSILTGIILDYKDNKYEMICEVLENEKESKTVIYKTTCNNIDSCLLNISKELNKELYISHLKSLILTQKMINKDIKYYDYFLRNSKSKMNFYVYFISDIYKDNLFSNDKTTSLFLKDLVDFNYKNYSSVIKLSFIDMIGKKIEYGIDNIYPNIIIKDNIISIESLIAFKNNNIVELNNEEGIIFNILSNNMSTSLLNIPCDNNYFSIILNNSNAKYDYDDSLNIKIDLSSRLSDYNCRYDLNDKKTINKLKRLVNNYLKKKTNELITTSKNNNIDFLGLTRYIYKHKKIKTDINNIKTNITVNTKITSIGESR